MGSDETATATTGGPRVIDAFDGTGAIGPKLFTFVYVDRLSDASAVGLMSGSRLRRMRRRLGS